MPPTLEIITPGHTLEPWEIIPVAGGYTHNFLFIFAYVFTTLLNVFLKPDTDLFVFHLIFQARWCPLSQAWIVKL